MLRNFVRYGFYLVLDRKLLAIAFNVVKVPVWSPFGYQSPYFKDTARLGALEHLSAYYQLVTSVYFSKSNLRIMSTSLSEQ